MNDTRVFPARVFGERADTGGKVELLLVEEREDGAWDAFYRGSSRPAAGTRLTLAGGELAGAVQEVAAGGRVAVRLRGAVPLFDILERHGAPPVPPYIKRNATAEDPRVRLDRERYQTVYARATGAVAAPTAGLHFTPALLAALAARGIRRTTVTLHVGPGTFKPVKTERPEDHVMESERYIVPEAAAASIAAARESGGRILAVGSTTVRTLETVAAAHGRVVAAEGRSELFIRPPYRFRVVDALLTNFHLPRSTLLMMISAFAGRERVLAAYEEAVRERYRFYSYGDCMLIM